MNTTPPKLTRAIAFAYFARQTTPLEETMVRNCLATPEGMLAYYTYLDEWERQHPQFYADVDTAHQRFADFTKLPVEEPTPPGETTHIEEINSLKKSARRRSFQWQIGLAASLFLLLGMWFTTDSWYYMTQINGYGQIRSFILPDSSEILLGANSSLSYPRYGFTQMRRVKLLGEAEFRIKHKPGGMRFHVEMPDQTTIEVLGTVFSVNSRRNSTRVVLESGRIKLTTILAPQPLLLVPGDMVTVSAQGTLQTRHQAETPVGVTWKDHRFIFASTPLAEVANQLHDVFGVTVQIPQQNLTNRTVSGDFRAETADDLLQALGMMMNLRVSQTQDAYLLSQ